MDSWTLKVLAPSDADVVLSLERTWLAHSEENEIDRQIAEWHSSWRQESLNHYLPMGWSFGVFDLREQNTLLGYALAQPLLFFGRQTQSLWLEHIGAHEPEVQFMLFDTAVRYARDKHLQGLLVSEELITDKLNSLVRDKLEASWQQTPSSVLSRPVRFFKTTKS